MKNFTILAIALVLSSTIEAQSVSVIEYYETMKLDANSSTSLSFTINFS